MPFLYRLVICTALLFTASQASRIAESRIANAINSEDEAEGVKIPQSVDPDACASLFPPPVNCFSNGLNDMDIDKCPVLCKLVEKKKKEETKIPHVKLQHYELVERGHEPAKVNAPVQEWSRNPLKESPKVVKREEVDTRPVYARPTKHVEPSKYQAVATNVALSPICTQLQKENEKLVAEGKTKKTCTALQQNICGEDFCKQFK
mmetsp:Transcript_90042/g.141097  ORF Transcript_90042/g.141097 Transcript_90042/m.141097 type:complete len:205 (-) Transcript_90042:116-730(-)